MPYTQVADLANLSHEVFMPSLVREYWKNSALFKSGALTLSEKMSAFVNDKGATGETPHLGPITGSSSVPDDSNTAIVSSKIGDGKDTAVKCYRSHAVGWAQVTEGYKGVDLDGHVAGQWAPYWRQEHDAVLWQHIAGILASLKALSGAPLVHSIAVDDDGAVDASTTMGSSAMIRGIESHFGDRQGTIVKEGGTGGIMFSHSKVVADMRENDLLSTDHITEARIPIETYLGFHVVPYNRPGRTPTGTGGTEHHYTSILLGPGAIHLGTGSPDGGKLAVETVEDSKAGHGGGIKDSISRSKFCFKIPGVSWKGTIAGKYPIDAELSAAGVWELVYDKQDIPLLFIEHN